MLLKPLLGGNKKRKVRGRQRTGIENEQAVLSKPIGYMYITVFPLSK
jgi:hypothetical protein